MDVAEWFKVGISIVGCVGTICCLCYIFGRKESNVVTKEELEVFKSFCNSTFARNDITNQRMAHIELTLADIKRDQREGFNRIYNKIDELPKRRDDVES